MMRYTINRMTGAITFSFDPVIVTMPVNEPEFRITRDILMDTVRRDLEIGLDRFCNDMRFPAERYNPPYYPRGFRFNLRPILNENVRPVVDEVAPINDNLLRDLFEPEANINNVDQGEDVINEY